MKKIKYILTKITFVFILASISIFIFGKVVFTPNNDMLFSSQLATCYIGLLYITVILIITTIIAYITDIMIYIKNNINK